MIQICPYFRLNPNEVLWVEGDANYSTIYYTNKRTEKVCITLKRLEEKLEDHAFYRIHKSNLVNMNYLERIDFLQKQVSIQGYNVPISRRKFYRFLKQLGEK